MSSSSTTAITPTNSNINKAAPKRFNNVTVSESKDEQIHLPAGMSKSQAREWLTTLERNEEQVINWSETIDAYPLDGALALQRVLESRFGGATKTGAIGWFGMEIPPFMVSIEVGVNETAHVPWGYFTIPIMPEHKIHASIEEKDKQLYFQLTAAIKRKYQPMMDQIVQQVRAEVKNGSIYKGQAFRLKFPTDNEAAQSNFNPSDFAPRFIDVAKKTDTLILSESVKEQVETYLFTPVVATELTRTHGIPLKRGILLEGKYGTGKTLTAAVLSALCVANGWTFIYLQNVVDLERAMRFARRYEPAVIFSEDIDTVMKTAKDGARDEEMNKILNTIDGVDMKNIEQMVVLTTNYVDLISKAMLRPGRLDAVITVEPPDQQAVVQLMRHYSAGLLSDEKDANLQEAAQLLAGNIPSVIREVVERSKLASIRRAVSENHKDVKINGKDVLVAAKGIAAHIKLLEEARPDKRSDIEKAADRLGTHVAEALQTISERSKPTNGSSTKVMAPAPSPSTKSLPQG
jgi:transitional endoplasmic reticulum ATPase